MCFECPKISKQNFELVIINDYKVPHLICPFVIVNTDILPEFERYIGEKNIVTVGFNRQAAVTFSSVSCDRFMVCLCKGVFTLSGKYICEQEFPVNTNIKNSNLLLSAITAALLCDIDISELEDLFL